MYQSIGDDDIYSEVASTWLDATNRLKVIDAIREIIKILIRDPTGSEIDLSKGLLWVGCAPIRAIYSVDEENRRVKADRIRQI